MRSETPAELTLAGWPLPDSLSHLRDKLIEENKWDIDPLALYDEADEEKRLILPQQYETLLRGATVHAAFHLIGWRVKETGGALFNLEVKEITVLKKPDPNLAEELMRSAPKKRKLAGPSWSVLKKPNPNLAEELMHPAPKKPKLASPSSVLKKPDPNLAEELMRSAPKKPKGPLTKQGRHE